MKFCVTCVYWMLLFTSVISSGLLFLLVASENTQGNEHLASAERKGNVGVHDTNFIIDDARKDKYESPEITVIEVQSPVILKTDYKDEFLQEKNAKVSSSFDAVHGEADQKQKDLDIVAESILQQPNFSQDHGNGTDERLTQREESCKR